MPDIGLSLSLSLSLLGDRALSGGSVHAQDKTHKDSYGPCKTSPKDFAEGTNKYGKTLNLYSQTKPIQPKH